MANLTFTPVELFLYSIAMVLLGITVGLLITATRRRYFDKCEEKVWKEGWRKANDMLQETYGKYYIYILSRGINMKDVDKCYREYLREAKKIEREQREALKGGY